MISRIFIKNHLSFKELELNFSGGLSVFTGVSGAGKSVLMEAILAVFGFGDSEAKLIEANSDYSFNMSEFGIEGENVNSFKFLKDKTARYFINNQLISKKNLAIIAKEHLKYLSVKEISEFENSRLIHILDILAAKNSPKFSKILADFAIKFEEFCEVKSALNKITNDEKRIEELKEFATFEINKIENISPKIGEFEELIATKKRLSKKDKIEEAWNRAGQIFAYEKAVLDALNLSEIDSSFFSDAINELKIAQNSVNFSDLDDLDIEKILDRIEALNSLIKRYGSVEEALSVLDVRKKELEKYEKIEFEKTDLQNKFDAINSEITALCQAITNERKAVLEILAKKINGYLKALYMSEISLNIVPCELSKIGGDEVLVNLNGVNLKNLSSGEINRLRLAFIASEANITNFGDGVLILDEIDANLSGKEAMSVANVLLELAKFYQIFAISHQPQLSSKADTHFLVEKRGEISSVKKLNSSERIKELARMISGEHITNEATNFAKKLLNLE